MERSGHVRKIKEKTREKKRKEEINKMKNK